MEILQIGTERVKAHMLLSSEPSMPKHELRRITHIIENDEPLPIADAAAFSALKLDEREHRRGLVKTGATVSAFGGYIALQTWHNIQGKDVPEIATLPPIANEALHVLYDTLQFPGDSVATAALGDHLPLAVLSASVLYAGGVTIYGLYSAVNNGSYRNRIRGAKEELQERQKTGTQRWQATPDSTVAFVAGGDPMAERIAAQRPGDIIQIAQQPVAGTWVHLPKEANRTDTLQALARADIAQAGEILFLPVKPKHEFLPGPEDFDMTVAEIVHHIQGADQFCMENGAPQKPVVVVGSKMQCEKHLESAYSTDNKIYETTLEQAMHSLEKTRDAPITVFDTTERIVAKIVDTAEGRPITLYGPASTHDAYKERFFGELRERSLPDCSTKEPVRVLYGANDYTTVNQATPDDIAVVLDPSEGERLRRLGMPPKRVIVVAEELLRVVSPYL